MKCRPCGVSSIFIPTTRKFEELINGLDYVRGYTTKPRMSLNPLLMLDYRCHSLPHGKIGKNFPNKIKLVLHDISSTSRRQIMKKYGFLDASNADSLKRRADSLIRFGFEHTLTHEAGNDENHTYPWQPSCCSMEVENSKLFSAHAKGYRCKHTWKPFV